VTATKTVTSSRAQILLADKAIAVAEDNAKAERLSFAAGKSTNFDVLDRQTKLIDSQLRRGRAVANYHQAVAQLQFLSGVILEQYRVNVRPRSSRGR
jgi:outer membrane protein TolC